MATMAEVEVVVTYRTTVAIPDGQDADRYIHEHWRDYDDDLIAQYTEREVITTWNEDEAEEAGA